MRVPSIRYFSRKIFLSSATVMLRMRDKVLITALRPSNDYCIGNEWNVRFTVKVYYANAGCKAVLEITPARMS